MNNCKKDYDKIQANLIKKINALGLSHEEKEEIARKQAPLIELLSLKNFVPN